VAVAVAVEIAVGDAPAVADAAGKDFTRVKKAARSTVTSQGGTPCGP